VATKSLLIRSMPACAALLALLACSSDDGAGAMEATDFCQAYVDAVCGGIEQCCSEITRVDTSACRSAANVYCQEELLTVDDRGIAPTGPNVPARIVFDFDEEGAAAAIARVKSAFARCEGVPSSVVFDDTHYLGEPGTECLAHQDCAEGTRCAHAPQAVFGTCVLAPLEGQECSDVCAAKDLWCGQDRGEPVCVALRGEGESCDELPCEEGLACLDASSTIGGGGRSICGRRGADGDPCRVDAQCDSYLCVNGRCNGGGSPREVFCSFFSPSTGLGSLAP
jgi:hypothetical protein